MHLIWEGSGVETGERWSPAGLSIRYRNDTQAWEVGFLGLCVYL